MKKILFIILPLFFAAAIFLGSLLLAPKGNNALVCFDNHCFDVEIANTPRTRENGLMFRKNLNEGRGMLFIFSEENINPFWMKNTLIPLDIIWLDSNQEIVFIGLDNEPCEPNNCPLINPGIPAKYVLEINAGLSEKIGLEIGKRMDIYSAK